MAERVVWANLARGGTVVHHAAADANDPLVLAVWHGSIVRQDELDGVGPIVLAALGACSEIAAAEILVLEQAMALAAEEEMTVFHRAFRTIVRQGKMKALRVVISAAQANARTAAAESHVAALLTEPPIALILGHIPLPV